MVGYGKKGVDNLRNFGSIVAARSVKKCPIMGRQITESKTMKKMNRFQKLALAGAFTVLAVGRASAQTDITGVIDSLDGYFTAAVAVGVAVLLFTLGRAIVRKVAR